jgi:hypothetical protein
VVNHHPQVDIIQRHMKPKNPLYIYNDKNKMLKIINNGIKHKNVDTTDNMRPTYS